MCGIAGFYSPVGLQRGAEEALRCMTDAIAYRGPDDEGQWIDPLAGIALGHRRLAILDLSPEGHQPMRSASGRYEIAFNGEVFNFERIRAELPQRPWRGHSDTEVMLAAIEEWGLHGAVSRFIGMFAFALWDRHGRALHLVRDRLGIKPLYYGWSGKTLLFGSELKALRAFPGFCPEIERDALAVYMRHNYVPHPYTIYRGVAKLTPGTIATFQGDAEPLLQQFWNAQEAAGRGIANPFIGPDKEAVSALETLLKDSVRLRMVSDVPLGAFLSGGIDSSAVVALMQAQSSSAVRTFSIGFDEEGFDEAPHAAAVARHLGTDHTELYVSAADALAVIPRLPAIYDEPFADSSQIPTFLVSQLTRRHVTVSLSGDGGDELFAGYPRYSIAGALWSRLRRVPLPLRRATAHLMLAVPSSTYDGVFRAVSPVLSPALRGRRPGEQAHRLAELLSAKSPQELYRGIVSHWDRPSEAVPESREMPTRLTLNGHGRFPDFTSEMMYLDLVSYLPDDILTKVDRASMAVSLEARVPLLDHRVVELAWRMPMHMKIRDGVSKWLLRQVLYKYVPQSLMERPKMGFGVPIGQWLRGPLREWAEDLLQERRLQQEGYFSPKAIRERWDDHVSGRRNWQYHLWDVLMFQAWLQESSRPVPAPHAAGLTVV